MAISRAAFAAALLLVPMSQAISLQGSPVGREQTGVYTGQRERTGVYTDGHRVHDKNEPCACLNWMDVYTTRGVNCGQGKELVMFGVNELGMHDAAKIVGPDIYDEYCTEFYMRSNHNTCLNKHFGTRPEQWCYVPKHCADTWGDSVGGDAGLEVGIHVCRPGGEDDLMNAKAPEDLNRIAKANNLEIGLFGKLSYAKSELPWSRVEGGSTLSREQLNETHTMESYYGLKWSGPSAVSKQLIEGLWRVTESGVPTIFDTDNGHGGGTLVFGKKIYGFLPTEGAMACRGCNGYGYGYVCLQGCNATLDGVVLPAEAA